LVIEMIPTKNANMPEVASLVDGQLYDIVYMGDKELKMFKYNNTLYIIDQKIDSPKKANNAISYITIDSLPTREIGIVDFFSQEAIEVKDISSQYIMQAGENFS
jgi:hypothetical protein